MLLRQGRGGYNSVTRILVCLFIDAHTHTDLCRKLIPHPAIQSSAENLVQGKNWKKVEGRV